MHPLHEPLHPAQEATKTGEPFWWDVPTADLRWRGDLIGEKPASIGLALVGTAEGNLVRPVRGRALLDRFIRIHRAAGPEQMEIVRAMVLAAGWLGAPSRFRGDLVGQPLSRWVRYSAIISELVDVVAASRSVEHGVESARLSLIERAVMLEEVGDDGTTAVDYSPADISGEQVPLPIPLQLHEVRINRQLAKAGRAAVRLAVERALLDGMSVSITEDPRMVNFVPRDLLRSLYLEVAVDLIGGSAAPRRACLRCGKALIGGRRDRLFCDSACRRNFNYHQTRSD